MFVSVEELADALAARCRWNKDEDEASIKASALKMAEELLRDVAEAKEDSTEDSRTRLERAMQKLGWV